MQDESDIEEGGWESVTIDMESWNLLVCQLERLVDVDCFIHTNHAKSMLSGVESPTLKKHILAVQNKRTTPHSKTQQTKESTSNITKVSSRIATLSVKGDWILVAVVCHLATVIFYAYIMLCSMFQ